MSGVLLSSRFVDVLFSYYLLHARDVSVGTLSSVAKQYYGNTRSASGSVRAWTWCRENVGLEENNLDNIGCDHTSTKAPDPIRTPERNSTRLNSSHERISYADFWS